MKVFLSHNSLNKDFVRRVATALVERGLDPWLDVWEMRIGDPLMPMLERAIENCDCFILFWSTGSKAAPWVEWERKSAERLRDKRRICILLDDIVPPPELSQRIWLNWSNWQDDSLFESTLGILIRSIYGKPPEERPPVRKPKKNADKVRKIRLTKDLFKAMFSSLNDRYGEQKWWERGNKFQLCLEAILSQGTSWKNVGMAIDGLKAHGEITPNAIREMSEEQLRNSIRPCGRANAKAVYIKNFIEFLSLRYELDLDRMLNEETTSLRRQLLEIKGIGEFTCDNILLYGADRPKLPINDRMRKVFFEHDLIDEVDTYESAQSRLENALPLDTRTIREFDAMIYRVAKDYCHTVPNCDGCPLKHFLHKQGPRSQRD